MDKMIAKKEALKRILENTSPIERTEAVRFFESVNRVLASDIVAPCDLPYFDNSAMDGFAVLAGGTKGASQGNPSLLKIVGELKAGVAPEISLTKGTAIRIMTGAPLPQGADAVVMLEVTEEKGEELKVFAEVIKGENVRRKGEDVKRGEIVLRKRKEIRSSEIGMLAGLGIETITVFRKPKVLIITTGDEIADIEEELPVGKIRDTNKWMLSTSLTNMGLTSVYLSKAKDNVASLKEQIGEAVARNVDMLLISGGVSVGKYDLVREVLDLFGFKEVFHKVAVKPGKPLLFGKVKDMVVFGLPGNPVSAMISFEVFVKPSLSRMMHKDCDSRVISAVLSEEIRKKPGRTHLFRVTVEKQNNVFYARPLKKQGSGMLSSLTEADGFIEIDMDKTLVKKGENVLVRFIE